MMVMRMLVIFLLPALPAAAKLSANVAPYALTSVGEDEEAMSVSDMQNVFARSEKAHLSSMTEISKGLTVPKALNVIQQTQFTATESSTAAFEDVANLILGQKKGSLRSKKAPGYSGIDGARNLLNDMIYESLSKYDAEIAKCTDFYSKQCALMEVARGAIAAANFVAANSRALILDA